MATYLLSVLVFFPLAGALATWFGGRTQRSAKLIALAFSIIETGLTTLLLLAFIFPGAQAIVGARISEVPPGAGPYVPLYYVERVPWAPQPLGWTYILGVDGLSVPLIWLTALLTTLAIVFHWDETQRPTGFFGILLFLEMALIGVFAALDFIIFFIFWELVLIPMFFLIGIWGGSNRRYAALKFLLYTHVGSVVMLLSIFALLWLQSESVNAAVYGVSTKTTDMTAFLHAAVRHMTPPYASYIQLGSQIPIFAGFLFGFIVKLPSFPVHTWLPDAHVEAPTGGSVILAGVLLKMGGYGIFRINLGMLPDAMRNLWWVLAILGTVSMVYAAFVCLAQVDLKRLIAYSSVGHMGFVLLGASSLTVIGVQGAIFQLFNHGIITAILFMLAGSVKHSTGTRDISELQGLAKVMPQFSFVLAIGFFASLGLPGLNSFWSEFMVFVGAYGSQNVEPMRRLILIPLISVVVTAAYYLYTMQRILFGDPPEKLGHPHDLLPWERVSYVVLVALVFLVGFFPLWFLGMINAYTMDSFRWLGGI
jgi:NADH-quinone oxidoreductase subunit M